jgi:hypothetical protein
MMRSLQPRRTQKTGNEQYSNRTVFPGVGAFTMRRPGLHPILVGFGDKAFLAALILIRLADYRRVAAQRCSLMHLPVIEEAHRPLANTALTQFGADGRPDGSSGGNLLESAVRDSRLRARSHHRRPNPGSAAADVVKNTNLKIAHRLIASDDRIAMAAAMAMVDDQSRASQA